MSEPITCAGCAGFSKRCADALADEVAVLVDRKVIDSRSPAADALLDYRNPPRSPRSDRIVELEVERDFSGRYLSKMNDAIGRSGVAGSPYHWDAIDQIVTERDTLRTRVSELERQLADIDATTLQKPKEWEPPGGLERRPAGLPRRRR